MSQNKFIHDWLCEDCGKCQSKHDQYFSGICERCNSEKLTAEEQGKLETILLQKIYELKRNLALDKISGGFCNITFVMCDADEIQYLVKYGTSDDTGRQVYTAYLTLDRNTFEETNFVESTDPPEVEVAYITHNEAKIECATCGAGSVIARYAELIALFGKPEFIDDIKSEAQWTVSFSDGEVGIIYDWKISTKYKGSNGIPLEQIEEWNIGSQTGSLDFQNRINELLENKRK